MTKLAYDASVPPANPPATDVVVIYIGGDTPHVWTPAEIAAQHAPFGLPAWVRSNPEQASAAADAAAAVIALHSMGCPPGSSVMLDLETAVDPPYVSAFGAAMHQVGYRVLPYGSRSTIFQNPALDGYFTAHPGATAIDPGAVGTQFAYAGAYDLSWILDTVPLWSRLVSVRYGFKINAPVADVLEWPHGGVLILSEDGGVFATNGAPYLGGAYGKPYFTGRTAAVLLYYPAGPRPGVGAMPEGYTIVSTSGERYNYPTGA